MAGGTALTTYLDLAVDLALDQAVDLADLVHHSSSGCHQAAYTRPPCGQRLQQMCRTKRTDSCNSGAYAHTHLHASAETTSKQDSYIPGYAEQKPPGQASAVRHACMHVLTRTAS